MAEGMTVTGLTELRAGAERLPAAVTAKLRATAQTTAARVLANARANLAARTHGQGNTASALQVTEDAANRQFIVEYGMIHDRPANLPLWLEYGFMQRNGQPHRGLYIMHDAATVEQDRYLRDMDAAAAAGATEALG